MEINQAIIVDRQDRQTDKTNSTSNSTGIAFPTHLHLDNQTCILSTSEEKFWFRHEKSSKLTSFVQDGWENENTSI